MRFSATILLVACCSASLVGCCNRFHRHSCLFGDRHRHDGCVDQQDWDDDDGHSCCPCDGGMMYDNPMPMQSFDSGCGCGCGGGMPQYMDAGMPMSMPSYQPSGCGCGAGGGGMMMAPPMQPMPTYGNQSMMMQPMPEATPTPAVQPPAAPPASSVPPATEFYSPRNVTPTSSVPAAF